MPKEFDIVEPRPDALVESLRAFGYNLQTAIADLVDNSITANSSHIGIELFWDGPDSWIRIADNGDGMNEGALVEAMRPGTRSPLEDRPLKDLGRFGLGLKTASFSQCRRLTVRSKAKGAKETTRCWNLDFVQKAKKWALLKSPHDATSEEALSAGLPDAATGTVVLWEALDRVVGGERRDDVEAQRHFLLKIDAVVEHLGMVFHRFLSQPRPIRIKVNGTPVKPWDPFLADHPATQVQPEADFGNRDRKITVQPYILPHESKLKAEAHQAAAGSKGWNAHQGFYIYRNRRLLSAGEWLGFYRQEEHYKLARIQVDIPNTLDSDWKIDVRKAHAHPPDQAKQFLRPIAEATRTRAAEVYRHRGRVIQGAASEPHIYMWQQVQRHGKIRYRINRDHPLIQRLGGNPPPSKADISALLGMIEETLPVNHILGNFAENARQQSAPFEDAPPEVQKVALAVGRALQAQGLSEKEIRRRLLLIDPFQHYPEIVAALTFNKSGDGE